MSTVPTNDPVQETVVALLECEAPSWRDFSHGWDLLSVEQFMEAMRLVIQQKPINVAAAWAQVRRRLADYKDLQAALLKETTGAIKSIDRLALLHLENASLDVRLAVVRSLDPLPAYRMQDEKWWDQYVPALELLVDVLCELHATVRVNLWKEMEPKFAAVHPVLMYRTVRRYIEQRRVETRSRDDEITLVWLSLVAKTWLEASGYKLGHIRMGTYQGRQQAYVETDEGSYRCRFVPHRRAHRYSPVEGDEVLYKPDHGVVLKNRGHLKVTAVYFIPVT